MCVNQPHVQVVAVLGGEAEQGHVGVEFEDVLRQLALLQLDETQTCKLVNTEVRFSGSLLGNEEKHSHTNKETRHHLVSLKQSLGIHMGGRGPWLSCRREWANRDRVFNAEEVKTGHGCGWRGRCHRGVGTIIREMSLQSGPPHTP